MESSGNLETHDAKELLARAVNEHRWYLGIEASQEVDWGFARESFMAKYFLDWAEEHLLECEFHFEKDLESSCGNMPEFVKDQMTLMRGAIGENQWYLGEREKHGIEWGDAEKDFFNNYMKRVAEKFRVDYCLYVCDRQEKCGVAEKYLSKLELANK